MASTKIRLTTAGYREGHFDRARMEQLNSNLANFKNAGASQAQAALRAATDRNTAAHAAYAKNPTNENLQAVRASTSAVHSAYRQINRNNNNIAIVQSFLSADYKKVFNNPYYIEFDVVPDINETATANYTEISDIRAPASILIYMGSPSRSFSINAKLVSRSIEEAQYNINILNILRSWRMPEQLLGLKENISIPTILTMSGYGNMFKDIPVVMTNLTIDLQSEFDAISSTDAATFVPIIVPVSISVKECRNQEEDLAAMSTFDIAQFRAGTLPNW